MKTLVFSACSTAVPFGAYMLAEVLPPSWGWPTLLFLLLSPLFILAACIASLCGCVQRRYVAAHLVLLVVHAAFFIACILFAVGIMQR